MSTAETAGTRILVAIIGGVATVLAATCHGMFEGAGSRDDGEVLATRDGSTSQATPQAGARPVGATMPAPTRDRECSSDDPFECEVRAQLIQRAILLDRVGMSPSHQVDVGQLARGGAETYTLQLRAGTSYVFTAACDDDCEDIDLSLASDGAELESDREPDRVPIISYTPSTSGVFELTVSVPSCRANPCRYGVGVFSE